MAYQNQGQTRGYAPRTGAATTAAPAGTQKREFTDDPNEVGIGYEKEMKSGEKFVSYTVTKDLAAGTKIVAFLNSKVKNKTERTPTHKLKLSIQKPK